ncbi:endonuclease/exonuclease/phosphatase family protein [Vibrio paucivorans]|uniref:UPF0294 protein MD483_03470 n=1 Tax=Vibrio paucivorans TaxID=2829489 RepID=A0A9X3HPW2_9VIBR|nr:endonuclease/exonuclease/phosphatase family protein [Vibrio paucivorans]MCW8332891.1 endonuclease/exonuclease/phosphatase family protein [Vibrio paucivorans]
MSIKKFSIAASVVLAVGFGGIAAYQSIFKLPTSPQLSVVTQDNAQPELRCFHSENTVPIDDNGQLSILVWNIYKQNRENWQQALNQYSRGQQLALLQEASMTKELKVWVSERQWFGSQVDAFKAFDVSAGVLNLSKHAPSLACAYTELEPWLRLPKSGLYAVYPLSNGQSLAVVNIHSVNFTYGTEEYQRQLDSLVAELTTHTGPIVFAGDFNSWSEERLAVMKSHLEALDLQEVRFSPDHRKEFINGLPLDHVFYRGLTLQNAKAPESDASDHNPLLVEFALMSNSP